jgi:hypothetical protein
MRRTRAKGIVIAAHRVLDIEEVCGKRGVCFTTLTQQQVSITVAHARKDRARIETHTRLAHVFHAVHERSARTAQGCPDRACIVTCKHLFELHRDGWRLRALPQWLTETEPDASPLVWEYLEARKVAAAAVAAPVDASLATQP